MPFIYRNLSLTLQDREEQLTGLLAHKLQVHPDSVTDLRIVRKGVDARKKQQIKVIYTVEFTGDRSVRSRLGKDTALEWRDAVPLPEVPQLCTEQRIVIVGMGPAGLFAALRLAEYGLTATVVERGEPVEQRAVTVQCFWKDGVLNPESNVQFGEGGAGTFPMAN